MRRSGVALAVFVLFTLGGVLPVVASVTSTVPWSPASGVYNPSNDLAGECNEDVGGVGSLGWEGGYIVYLACRGVVENGMQIYAASGAVDVSNSWIWNGSGYQAYSSGWQSVGPDDVSEPYGAYGGYNNDCPIAGNTSLTGQLVQQVPEQTNYFEGSCITGSADSHASSGYDTDAYFSDVGYGASETASNGHAYQAFHFYEQIQVNPNPISGNGVTGVALGHPMQEPSSGTPGNQACNTPISVSDPPALATLTTEIPGTGYNVAPFDHGGSYSPNDIYDASMAINNIDCSDNNGDFRTQSHVTMPPTFFTGDTPVPQEPCDLVSETGPTEPQNGNTTATYTLTYAGGADYIVADPLDGSGADLTSQVVPGTSLGYSDDATVVAADSSKVSSLAVTTTHGGGQQIDFTCVYDGTAYDWGLNDASTMGYTPAPAPSSVGGGSFDISQCFAATGFDLYNPITWVTGALKDGLCIVEWLFIPSSDSLDSFSQLFGVSDSSDTGSQPAGVWIGSLGNLLLNGPSTAVTQLQTDEASGSCSGGAYVLDTHTFSPCTALASVSADSTVTSAFSPINDILTAGFLLVMFFALLHFIRKVLQDS